ncbi:metal-dependent transcriptional regulator [Acidobacteria bacterium AH-259-G07]|nr:metal-dependent transcriptional regulator [Acidobacteria bacterium AH-259-G07]
MISRAMEDYLKAIYRLASGGKKVSTSRLAQEIHCSAASVTNMLQKLSAMKLVEYEPYQGVTLTGAGRKIALEVTRHHRLIELYLMEILGYSWDKVHAEAEELEHVISEEFEEKIDEALGHPTTDPHGDPIPSKDGQIDAQRLRSLWDMSGGESVKVGRVSDRNPEVLRYLASIGIFPEVEIGVVEKAPFNGPIHIQIDDAKHSLSEELARQIFVIPT